MTTMTIIAAVSCIAIWALIRYGVPYANKRHSAKVKQHCKQLQS